MIYDKFNVFCRSLQATTYVVQWHNSHVWKIGGKVFAIAGLGNKDQVSFIFKASEQNFHFLCQHPHCKPAPYFASRGMKWIQYIHGNDALNSAETTIQDEELNEELTYYLMQSYQLVSQGLTKKKQRELAINQ